jgi:hypothetical protein
LNLEKFRKKTRKERFLDDMEQIIPWQEPCGAIEPHYPKPEGAGRRPVGIERMLRIHFLQHRLIYTIPVQKRPCTIPEPCGLLSALTWAGSRCQTRQRSVTFVT